MRMPPPKIHHMTAPVCQPQRYAQKHSRCTAQWHVSACGYPRLTQSVHRQVPFGPSWARSTSSPPWISVIVLTLTAP